MKILKIGVTGSAGSGKSLVCKGFAELGLNTFDCDRIARQVVEPGKPAYDQVVALFGAGVVGPDLQLDRARIRQIIVDDGRMRQALEAIVHPQIIREMQHLMDTAVYAKEPACAVEVPLLFELDMASYFDLTLVVTADQDLLEERIAARDGVSVENARKMLALQMSQAEKAARADVVIENKGDRSELLKTLETLYNRLKKERLTKKI